ncbi:hypothetical protein [Nostoc sp.]|uniref:hypothetical protein n=1 Tax=Nostoc sp. TaxID=1180 RepID=UPI002FFB4A6C
MKYQQGYREIEKVLQGIDSRLKNPTQWPVVDAHALRTTLRWMQRNRHRFTTTG